MELDNSGTRTKIPHPDLRRVGTSDCFVHRDHLASVKLETDASGTLSLSNRYIAYGEEVPVTATEDCAHEARGFVGGRHDVDTGLLDLNARWYDPALGRFTSPDWFDAVDGASAVAGGPIGWLANVVGTNRYAYAGDDPVNKSDPNGHEIGTDYTRGYTQTPGRMDYDPEGNLSPGWGAMHTDPSLYAVNQSYYADYGYSGGSGNGSGSGGGSGRGGSGWFGPQTASGLGGTTRGDISNAVAISSVSNGFYNSNGLDNGIYYGGVGPALIGGLPDAPVLTPDALAHILERHGAGTPNPTAGKFYPQYSTPAGIAGLVADVWAQATPADIAAGKYGGAFAITVAEAEVNTQTGATRPLNIGTSGIWKGAGGLPNNLLTMVVDSIMYVITLFPSPGNP